MLVMIGLITLLLLTFFIWEIVSFYRRRAALPPGPFAVPILGNFINEIQPPFVHVAFKRLSARFGSVFTVHMPHPIVNISDFETMRDAFRGNDVTGRMKNALFDATQRIKNGGLVFSDGDDWVEQRRFVIATLRNFGMGKNLMEDKVRLSAKNMADFIEQKDLSNVDLRRPIQVFVANIINEFLFGFQYSCDNCDKLMDFVDAFSELLDEMSRSPVVPIMLMLPWTRQLPIIRSYWKEVNDRNQKMFTFILNETSAVKNDPTEEPTCYVQAFKKSNKDKRPGQLVACCADMFIAGMETTTTTLRWGMLFLAADQRVQDKLRAEICTHIDQTRGPHMADKARVPYASAVIHEIQRRGNFIAPNPILFHRTTVDTTIGGFSVPANTIVNGDIHQIMNSDPVFQHPDRFWPERYLEEDGATLKKELVERTIPFGIGKRQCAGEGLARTELFIGLVTLVQRFRILPLPTTKIDLEPIYSTVHFPKPHNFRLERI